MTATLTSKGQVTIPKAVRDRLNLAPGDKLEFVFDTDGAVRLVAMTSSVQQLKQLLPPARRIVSLDEMDQAIAAGASAQ